ncbi:MULTISPECIES: DUF5655 domain-containing protein [Henriciella]|jgi:predicted transport protein|uniref:DUF5655 domain-containing protein n=1 Tax=Henriciella TaxID=453849 RepID=UPI003515FEA3
MGDIKLFRVSSEKIAELEGKAADLEKSLQTQFERNLDALLGVRFLASEFQTSNGGRMDTLGIDENGCPVIIEYKRDRNENVINQGLFYLDWLMDHRGDFEVLVRDRLGIPVAETIEWSAPRLICIAGDFTRYDEHAVKQMSRNIELIRYKKFGEDLLLLDQITAVSATNQRVTSTAGVSQQTYKTVSEYLLDANEALSNLYADTRIFLLSLGDDVQESALRFYFAFKRIKNFACVEVKPQLGVVRLYLKVNPDEIDCSDGFCRDVRNVGHFGTGDLELTLKNHDDLERAKPLILRSYEAS